MHLALRAAEAGPSLAFIYFSLCSLWLFALILILTHCTQIFNKSGYSVSHCPFSPAKTCSQSVSLAPLDLGLSRG